MRIIITLILLSSIGISNAQNIDKAKQICRKYIINGKALTPNETVDSLKSGIWAHPYHKHGIITDNKKDVESFLIVSYKTGVPVGFCAICGVKSNLLSIESYIEDTTWTENGTFLWFNKKEILTNEEHYTNGLLSGKKAHYYKNGQIKSNFEYRNDTVINAKHYWSNGNLQKTYECNYTKDTTIIITNQYTKEGVLLNSNRTVNDLKDGNNIVYYKNGSKRIEGIDLMGIRAKEVYFNQNGEAKKIINCDPDTKQCKVVEYNKNNQIKKEYTSTFKGYGTVIYK